MGRVSDALTGLAVSGYSPDGRIQGRVTGDQSITFRFVNDSYENHYRHRHPETLSRQMEHGADLVMVQYYRARREVMTGFGFEQYTAARPPWRRRHREFLEQRRRTWAYGSALDGTVEVSTTGLALFTVSIAPSVLDHCDERHFLAAMSAAVTEMKHDYFDEIAALRHELRETVPD